MNADLRESEVELTIDSIAAGGDGVGRSDGMVIFVPRTAPGDRVRARVDRRKRFGRGTLLSIIAPSSGRVEPQCPHYVQDGCGGCQLQHLDYRSQLDVKARIIRDALTRIGKRPIDKPARVEPSLLEWRYRSKLTLAMRFDDGQWTIGLRRFDDPDAVFQLDDCLITDARVITLWKMIMQAAPAPARGRAPGVRPTPDRFRGSNRCTCWRHRKARAIRFLSRRAVAAGVVVGARASAACVGRRAGASAAGASFRQVNDAVAERLLAERPRSCRDVSARDRDRRIFGRWRSGHGVGGIRCLRDRDRSR